MGLKERILTSGLLTATDKQDNNIQDNEILHQCKDLGNLNDAVKEALKSRKPFRFYKKLGENKTLLMVFFNNSLRTASAPRRLA